MAASFAAALLDELMGRNRDVHPSQKRKTHWSDAEVCKPFLCGFCPNYLFTNTRADLGKCDKIHDEDFRESYKKSPRFEKMGYEREFTDFLKSLISEVDKRIRRGEQRLVLNSQPTPILVTPQMTARQQRIDHLSSRIGELVEEAEALGCDGNVDQAQRVMILCEQMRDERTTLVALNETEKVQLEQANEPAKAMEVCVTCGALLVLNDTHQRMDEHVIGKQHMGYAQIRAYLVSRKAGSQENAVLSLEPGESVSIPDESEATMLSSKKVGEDLYHHNNSQEVSTEECYVINDAEESRRLAERRRDRPTESRHDRDERRQGNATSSRHHRSRSKDRSHSNRRSSTSPANRKRHGRHSDSSSRRQPNSSSHESRSHKNHD